MKKIAVLPIFLIGILFTLTGNSWALSEQGEEIQKVVIWNDSVQGLAEHLGCSLCHKMPLIHEYHTDADLGPSLVERSYQERLADNRYKGKAKTEREYLRESIINPDIYIAPKEAEGELYPMSLMPANYGEKMSSAVLELLLDLLINPSKFELKGK